MGGWHSGWGGGDWALMGLLMLTFWSMVIVGIVWLARAAGMTHGPAKPEDRHNRARHILDERFARGELTKKSTAGAVTRLLSTRPHLVH